MRWGTCLSACWLLFMSMSFNHIHLGFLLSSLPGRFRLNSLVGFLTAGMECAIYRSCHENCSSFVLPVGRFSKSCSHRDFLRAFSAAESPFRSTADCEFRQSRGRALVGSNFSYCFVSPDSRCEVVSTLAAK